MTQGGPDFHPWTGSTQRWTQSPVMRLSLTAKTTGLMLPPSAAGNTLTVAFLPPGTTPRTQQTLMLTGQLLSETLELKQRLTAALVS